MNKLLAGIVALGLLITSLEEANAKQIVTPIISEKNTNILTNKSDNISEISLPYKFNDKQLIAQSVARLNFSWRAAHDLELAAVGIKFILTAQASDFVGLALLLASGHDVYLVRVRLNNTGDVPLRVYPQYLKAYYGNQFTSVIPIADNRFLQPDILQPNYYIDKPVIFIAPYGLNLQRDVQMGYADNSIQVIND
jgi:hypothetical protein